MSEGPRVEGVINNSVNNNVNPSKTGIEKEIENFKNGVRRINDKLDDVNQIIKMDVSNVDVTSEIKEITQEVDGLNEEAKKIIEELNSFSTTRSDNTEKTASEIRKEITQLKVKLKDVKNKHKKKYNDRVNYVNSEITKFKSMNVTNDEVVLLINELKPMSLCEISINDYRNFNYLSQINYNELIRITNLIVDIKSKLSLNKNDNVSETLESEMLALETSVNVTEMDEITVVKVSENINAFNIKLESNRSNVEDVKYNEYVTRLNKVRETLSNLKKEENNLETVSIYNNFKNKLNVCSAELNMLKETVKLALKYPVSEELVEKFKSDTDRLVEKLNAIKEEVDKKQEKMEENQYKNLKRDINSMKNSISSSVRRRLSNPSIVTGSPSNNLTNNIKKLSKDIRKLKETIWDFEKKVDRKNRKEIDKRFERLEEDIKYLEGYLEDFKDDRMFYETTKIALNKQKEDLNEAGKVYRSKCPLMVKSVKSAKNVYKKHPKIALTIAGLSTIALLSATVGKVLIPAIIHGNIMVGAKWPASREFIKVMNNFLGGLIGATKDVNGVWRLASGAMINPSVASTSLIKGLAWSVLGHTAIASSVLISIKKLVEVMKALELKEKFGKTKNVVGQKVKNSREKRNELVAMRKTVKGYSNKTQQMLYKYSKVKDKMSFDAFCEENKLSEIEKINLKALVSNFEELIERKRSGRKGK